MLEARSTEWNSAICDDLQLYLSVAICFSSLTFWFAGAINVVCFGNLPFFVGFPEHFEVEVRVRGQFLGKITLL